MTLHMIADRDFPRAEELARYVYGMPRGNVRRRITRISTWTQFRNAARNLRGVDHLVIYTHGDAGSLILNGENKSFSLVRDFLSGMPQIAEISLEGCNVGRDPRNMAVLGRLFRARKVNAYNMYHVVNHVGIRIPRGMNRDGLAQVRGVLDDYRPFFATSLADGSDLQRAQNAWAGDPGRYRVFCEWFRREFDSTPPTLSAFGGAPRGYFTRASATQVTHQDNGNLPGPSDELMAPLRRVTVELPAAQPAQAPARRQSPARRRRGAVPAVD